MSDLKVKVGKADDGSVEVGFDIASLITLIREFLPLIKLIMEMWNQHGKPPQGPEINA